MLAQKPNIECHRNPPSAGVLMQQDRSGNVVPGTFTVFPIMRSVGWCGEWKARLDGIN